MSEDTNERIQARIAQLLAQAGGLTPSSATGQWVTAPQRPAGEAFLTGAVNLVGLVTGRAGAHWDSAQRVLTDERFKNGIPWQAIQSMQGILSALQEDMAQGLLTDLRLQDFAVAFDDFLDQADVYHRAKKLQESAVLASAVLEDVMRKIAEKNEIADSSMEDRINALVKKGVFTSLFAKRVKAWAAVRTSAFHARWEELDLPGVGEAIRGIRGLIDEYLV